MDDDDKPAKRKRKPKDPNAPKRPASSYIMFQNEIRKDLKEKNPNITNSDLLLLISKKWAEMSEEDKAVCRVASCHRVAAY
ncbi:high mobility group box domain-containing protein [Lyophyllum atratum]|nr:high mobility group box domain-containing protein [Lyophyllum atratum]